MQDSTGSPIAEGGLVLMDLSLKPLAFDRGAVAILKYPNQPDRESTTAYSIPKEILTFISGLTPTDLSSIITRFRIGQSEYICRSYLVESHNGFLAQPIVALRLQKAPSMSDAIDEVASSYHLTAREQEALTGISSGLTNKEVAWRMSISSNTVRAFVRLIMIKLGVTTRREMVAKILAEADDLLR